jgi:hypothetical protein
MNPKKQQKNEPAPQPRSLEMIEAADRKIKDYLLLQYLSLWHPISTAPNNHDLEVKVPEGTSSVALPFPCKRTNAGEWLNADLETGIDIQPVKWRPWQKQKRSGHSSAPKMIFITPTKMSGGGAIHE